MSTRTALPSPDRCRFAFADGRRCRQLAHASFDGLCYTHGTFAPRASRQDNFLRELAPITGPAPTDKDYQRTYRTLARAVIARRVSAERAAALLQLTNVMRRSQRNAQAESFHCHCGSTWDHLVDLLDDDPLLTES